MTTQDPKPARRIPDEGLYTLNFRMAAPNTKTFLLHTANLSRPTLMSLVARHAHELPPEPALMLAMSRTHGELFSNGKEVGKFTVTPPTLKGDPDEPT